MAPGKRRSGLPWGPLAVMLQSPAHRVLRVLDVTRVHWAVGRPPGTNPG
jgi:hypothetical protein